MRGERQKEQCHTGQRDQVPVALEVDGPREQCQRGYKGDHANRRPGGLGRGLRLVQFGDEDVARPVQQRRQRQQDGVRLGCQPAQAEVGQEHQREDERQEGDDPRGYRLPAADAGERVKPAREGEDHDDHAQLAAPSGRMLPLHRPHRPKVMWKSSSSPSLPRDRRQL